MNEILAKIEAHETETRRLNDELLAERDATQSKIEQLTEYRYELDVIIQRRGIRMDGDRSVHVQTNNPCVVRRSPREKEAYVASVPVERGGSTITQIVRDVMSDGQKRSKSEIYDLVVARKPELKRPTLDVIITKMDCHSCVDTRIGARRASRVYWLPGLLSDAF